MYSSADSLTMIDSIIEKERKKKNNPEIWKSDTTP